MHKAPRLIQHRGALTRQVSYEAKPADTASVYMTNKKRKPSPKDRCILVDTTALFRLLSNNNTLRHIEVALISIILQWSS